MVFIALCKVVGSLAGRWNRTTTDLCVCFVDVVTLHKIVWCISVDCWVLLCSGHNHLARIPPCHVGRVIESKSLPGTVREQIAKQLPNHIKSVVLCSLYYFYDSRTQHSKYHDRLHRDKTANVEWLKHYERRTVKRNCLQCTTFYCSLSFFSIFFSCFVWFLYIQRFTRLFIHPVGSLPVAFTHTHIHPHCPTLKI